LRISVAIEANDREIFLGRVIGVFIDMMKLDWFPGLSANTASAIRQKQHSCRNLLRNLCTILFDHQLSIL
jgi:hypothetical protein